MPNWLNLISDSIQLGSCLTFVSLLFEHPFDTIRTVMQHRRLTEKQASIFIYTNKKFIGFYSGFFFNVGRAVAKQIYRWPLMTSIQVRLRLMGLEGGLLGTCVGLSVAIIQTAIITPLERVKVWLMTSNQLLNTRRFFQQMSIKNLYDGTFPVLLRQIVSWTTFLGPTELLKRLVRKSPETQLTVGQLFLISTTVGIINTFFVLPFDYIKTQRQGFVAESQSATQSEPKSFRMLCKHHISRYSYNVLFTGWRMKLIQYAISGGFTTYGLERLLRKYERLSQVKQ